MVLTPTDLTYTLTAEAPAQHCAELRFSITASNALGDSIPAVVIGGFPKGKVLREVYSACTYCLLFNKIVRCKQPSNIQLDH